jgi:Zn-dependent M28 family amino/carboxypeptidase
MIRAEDLRSHVETLAGEIGERNVFRRGSLQASATFLEAEWRAQGHEVSRQTYRVRGQDCSNVEVTVPGAGRPGEILLVGAHYDSVQGSPGADDNASGVAVLLELGRALAGASLARTVRLVAFVNEEPPFFLWGQMGSTVYAKAARRRGDDIRLMISLEMLGCYSDRPGSQAYPPLFRYFYPDRADFIALVSNLRWRRELRRVADAFRAGSDFPLEHVAAPALVPGISWSDHRSFWRQGYPALMLTDTAFYRYAHYHTARDTSEHLDYERMARLADGLRSALGVLASDSRRTHTA